MGGVAQAGGKKVPRIPGVKRVVHCAFAGLLLTLFSVVAAAQSFPFRPIKIVVPLAAGGTGDTLARLLAEELSKPFGVAVIVENRPGSGGTIGTEAVARSAPDGQTLLHTIASRSLRASPIPTSCWSRTPLSRRTRSRS